MHYAKTSLYDQPKSLEKNQELLIFMKFVKEIISFGEGNRIRILLFGRNFRLSLIFD